MPQIARTQDRDEGAEIVGACAAARGPHQPCKEIAHLKGKAVSFMAKPDYELAGNSCHIHSSLWDAKSNQPLFHDTGDDLGMSKLFKHYVAGR